jgi:hypothetical protein
MKRLAATLSFLLSFTAIVAIVAMPNDKAQVIVFSVGAATLASIFAGSFVWFACVVGGDLKR